MSTAASTPTPPVVITPGPGPVGQAQADDDLVIPGVTSRGRAMAIAGGGILVFGVLVVMAVGGGEDERPDSWTEDGKGPAPASATAAAPGEDEASPTPAAQATPTAQAAPEPIPEAPQVAAGEAEADVPDAPQEPAPEAPAAPMPIRLRVRTVPSNAQLLLDGSKVDNPLDRELVRGSDHKLLVRADGYQEASWSYTLDASRQLTLKLKRLRRATPAARKPARKKATQTHREPPQPVLRIAPQKPTPKKKSKGAAFVADSPY